MSIFGYSLFQGLNKLLWPQQVNWTFQLITPQLLLFKHVFANAQKSQQSSLVIKRLTYHVPDRLHMMENWTKLINSCFWSNETYHEDSGQKISQVEYFSGTSLSLCRDQAFCYRSCNSLVRKTLEGRENILSDCFRLESPAFGYVRKKYWMSCSFYKIKATIGFTSCIWPSGYWSCRTGVLLCSLF